jgi:hypothetical protein
MNDVLITKNFAVDVCFQAAEPSKPLIRMNQLSDAVVRWEFKWIPTEEEDFSLAEEDSPSDPSDLSSLAMRRAGEVEEDSMEDDPDGEEEPVEEWAEGVLTLVCRLKKGVAAELNDLRLLMRSYEYENLIVFVHHTDEAGHPVLTNSFTCSGMVLDPIGGSADDESQSTLIINLMVDIGTTLVDSTLYKDVLSSIDCGDGD